MILNLRDDFAVKLMEMIDNGLCVELGMKSIQKEFFFNKFKVKINPIFSSFDDIPVQNKINPNHNK